MRYFAAALMVVAAGCAFHVQGTTPPGGDPTQVAPNDPTTPDPPPTTPPPTTPPSDPPPTPPPGGDPTPAPPTAASDAGAPPSDMTAMPLALHVGDPCTSDSQCTDPGVTCLHSVGKGIGTIPLPGGYCSKPCDPKTACPTGSECIATLAGPFCMNSCPATGCRSGYACCKSVNACGPELFCSDPLNKGPDK